MSARDIRQPGRAVLLAGPLGSGKTSVAIAIGQLLDEARAPHALIDLDWLCWAGPDLTADQLSSMMVDNLAALASRAALDGITTLVLARAVRSLDEVALVRTAVGRPLVALRLSVPPEVAAARLRLGARPVGRPRARGVLPRRPAGRLPRALPHGRAAARRGALARLARQLRAGPPA